MLIVGSGKCLPILVLSIRIFSASPTKPIDMVRTILCPGKTFFPFNCERKLIICYSAIYYSWVSGSGIKTILLGYFWCAWILYWLRIRITTAPFRYGLLWGFGFGFFRASRIRTCSFTTVCSWICISNFGLSIRTQWFKKDVTRVDVIFVFFFLQNQFSNNSFRCIGVRSFVMASTSCGKPTLMARRD